MNNFMKKDFKICEHTKIWLIISAVIAVIGILVMCIWNLNFGIDFKGGTIMEVKIGSYLNDNKETAKSDLNKIFTKNGLKVEQTLSIGEDETSTLSFRFENSINGKKASMEEIGKVKETVQKEIETYVMDKTTKDDAKGIVTTQTMGQLATQRLITNTFLAIVVAALGILIYVAFRFKLSSGVVAVLALLHDVIIMVACTAIFRIQVNSTFIAAVITIIGYSINNTIVIYDRIRENLKKETLAGKSYAFVANLSIKETLTRSINTTLTTLFTIVMLAILGVPSIKEFSLPIIFGLLAGFYSSVFLSASVWANFKDYQKARKDKANKQTKNPITKTTTKKVKA